MSALRISRSSWRLFKGELSAFIRHFSPANPCLSHSESGDGDIEARKLSLGTIVKELGTGAVTSGAVAALTHFLGGGNDSKANRRALEELEARGLGSLLGKLIPSATESVSKVLKNSIVGGLASGGVLAAGEALLGNDKYVSCDTVYQTYAEFHIQARIVRA